MAGLIRGEIQPYPDAPFSTVRSSLKPSFLQSDDDLDAPPYRFNASLNGHATTGEHQ